MENFIYSSFGWFHFLVSLVALAAGTYVLSAEKGTKRHKQVGYIYVFSMIMVCGSAFGLYNLTGEFGIFHVAAIIGFVTLAGGMLPLVIRNFPEKYKGVHPWFMYYSVMGLYAALVSELSVRIPAKPFFTMVGIATFLVFGIGTFFILRKQAVWSKYFED